MANKTEFEENQCHSTLKRKACAIKISFHLFQTLNGTIQKLKRSKNYGVSKQEWVTAAIREKIKNDKNKIENIEKSFSTSDDPPKQITLFLDEKSDNEIKKHLKVLRNSGDPTLSKKNWIIEAIKEKLSRDKVL
ncbi:MAG: hypothetical protein KDK96_10100 [Chlamydiia bacterium]|nr:hypothetical protein [Chlamydiia bacterium]